jgi:hypothetical protein
MMPSTVTDSPALSHHRVSQMWHEQKFTSVPSGKVMAISITEFCPQDTHVNPESGAFSMMPPNQRVAAQRRSKYRSGRRQLAAIGESRQLSVLSSQ